MIQSHRRRHPVIIAVVALASLTVLVLGLAARRQVPTMDSLPVTSPRGDGGLLLWATSECWPRWPVSAQVRVIDDDLVLDLRVEQALTFPDVLIYWQHEGESGLANAFLIGSATSDALQSFRLPPVCADATGRLLLYSLAKQDLVDRSAVVDLTDGGRRGD